MVPDFSARIGVVVIVNKTNFSKIIHTGMVLICQLFFFREPIYLILSLCQSRNEIIPASTLWVNLYDNHNLTLGALAYYAKFYSASGIQFVINQEIIINIWHIVFYVVLIHYFIILLQCQICWYTLHKLIIMREFQLYH